MSKTETRSAAPYLMGQGSRGAFFPIGVVADLLGVTDQTLRLYEAHGLVKPARRNRERYYCVGDIQWIECLRQLIHTEKVSIEGIKRLLRFAPCWEIIGPPREMQCRDCPVFRERSGGPALNGVTSPPSNETSETSSRM